MAKYIDTDVLEKNLDSQLKRIQMHITNDELKLTCALLVYGIHLDIENTPTADVRENVHARWKVRSRTDKWEYCECQNCGDCHDFHRGNRFRYCPNCGSEMSE